MGNVTFLCAFLLRFSSFRAQMMLRAWRLASKNTSKISDKKHQRATRAQQSKGQIEGGVVHGQSSAFWATRFMSASRWPIVKRLLNQGAFCTALTNQNEHGDRLLRLLPWFKLV